MVALGGRAGTGACPYGQTTNQGRVPCLRLVDMPDSLGQTCLRKAVGMAPGSQTRFLEFGDPHPALTELVRQNSLGWACSLWFLLPQFQADCSSGGAFLGQADCQLGLLFALVVLGLAAGVLAGEPQRHGSCACGSDRPRAGGLRPPCRRASPGRGPRPRWTSPCPKPADPARRIPLGRACRPGLRWPGWRPFVAGS